jgi:acyl-CoA thioesterase
MIETKNDASAVELRAAPADLNESLGFVEIISFDKQTSRIRMEYDARQTFCHSGGVVQGGFITGWIDAAMAHSVVLATDHELSPLSLEIKVTFLKSVSPGRVFAEGWVEKRGRSICFLEGQLVNTAGEILAKGTSTAKLVAIK